MIPFTSTTVLASQLAMWHHETWGARLITRSPLSQSMNPWFNSRWTEASPGEFRGIIVILHFDVSPLLYEDLNVCYALAPSHGQALGLGVHSLNQADEIRFLNHMNLLHRLTIHVPGRSHDE